MSPLAEQALRLALMDRAMTGTPIRRFWSTEEEQQLIRLYPDTPMPQLEAAFQRPARAIYHKARSLCIKRSDAYLASEHACRLRRGENVGKEHRFKPGNEPWNAGIKGLVAGGRSAETRFKKGSRPHTWVPIGTEQVRDGYLWRKVTDGNGRHDWRQVHVMLWEHHNGQIPAGMILVFRDRDRSRIQIDNLELIDRAELCRRNSIHRYPPELKHAIRKLAKLKRAVQEKSHEEPT
jgi:hypothetical protein